MPLSPGEHPLDPGARPQLEPEVLQAIVSRWPSDSHQPPDCLFQSRTHDDDDDLPLTLRPGDA